MELTTIHSAVGFDGDETQQRGYNNIADQISWLASQNFTYNTFAPVATIPMHTSRLPPPSFVSDMLPYQSASTNIGVRQRRQVYTEAEWDQIRPIFEKLYANLGLRLVDIQKIISDEHGLHATISMYKKRITKWNLTRNAKSTTKNAIIQSLQNDDRESISGAKVDPKLLCKTIRHAQELRKARKLSNASYEKFLAHCRSVQISRRPSWSSFTSNYIKDLHWSILLTEITHFSPDFSINTVSEMETLLFATKDRVQFLTIHSPSSADGILQAPQTKTIALLDEANDFLDLQNYSRARNALASIGDTLEFDLLNNALEIMLVGLDKLEGLRKRSGDWRDAVLRYTVSMSSKLLGMQNPISLFFKGLSQLYDVAEAYIRIHKCIFDVLMAHDQKNLQVYIPQIRLYLAFQLLEPSNSEQVVKISTECLDSLDDLHDVSMMSIHNELRCGFLLLKMVSFYLQDELWKALEAMQEALELARRNKMATMQIRICRTAGLIHYRQSDDIGSARSFHKSAFEITADDGEAEKAFRWKLLGMRNALLMFRNRNTADQYQEFIEEFTEIYHLFLENTDNKRAWLTGRPCTMGRLDCICQGNFLLNQEDELMDIQGDLQEDDNAWLDSNISWMQTDHDPTDTF